MTTIEIYGAFHFLDKETKIGTLQYERLKGSASYRFVYDEAFLASRNRFQLSADLGNYSGWQSSQEGIFAFLNDAMPDRWGRALIDKRERLLAVKQNRPARTFDDFAYLVNVDDFTRMGALRFQYDGKTIGLQSDGRQVPPVESIARFIYEAHALENADIHSTAINENWLNNVWIQGSSLGGARPKANIIDEEGNLWIAKVPSIKDTYDVALWEHFESLLAKSAGIKTAETQLIQAGPTPYHTLLSKRFDRNGKKRVHFASSLTLAGLHDGDGADTNKGYIDIADTIVGNAGIKDTKANLEEVFLRAAFNIMTGNHDDHFRNHGFLLEKDGWTLSPAYDMNPTNFSTQALLVSPESNESSLKTLYKASEYYLLEPKEAEEIIRQTIAKVSRWDITAAKAGISPQERQRFRARIESSINEGRALFPEKKTVEIQNYKKTSGPRL